MERKVSVSNRRKNIEEMLQRVDDTLETAKLGLSDLVDVNRNRRMSGLRNLIVFGRSATFVLQNLRSVIGKEFDAWYEPHQQSLKDDPLMRYFVDARNELEKQGKLSIATNTHIHSLSSGDIAKLGQRPSGATGFFIGDQLGGSGCGSGWEVQLPDGSKEKYYVELPTSIAEVKQRFSNLPEGLDPALKDATVEDLSQRYLEHLAALVAAARAHFLKVPAPQ